ncbi:hypothetical protein TNCV_2083611 [Trichonephila clavipes]|uniref:Uncharacterized protein n=1 Tax=Trichonephila clavipes TaxID=2585209 RepID=A0A8X6RQM8_TRICX|nr:hypothetical protein TNCV_2083611 [Trichonephila clavipes]
MRRSVCIIQDFRRDPILSYRASSSRVSESRLIPANDPKCVGASIYSEDRKLASFKNFIVIHSVFSGVIARKCRDRQGSEKGASNELAEGLGFDLSKRLEAKKLKDIYREKLRLHRR